MKTRFYFLTFISHFFFSLPAYADALNIKPGQNVVFEHVLTIGSKGSADGQFGYVEDFAFDLEGNLLATDAVNSNVQKFNPLTGQFLGKFGGKGEDDGKFEKPEGIAVDPAGNIFVADYATGYIQKFDKDFRHLKTFSDFGEEPGENMESEFMVVAHNLLYMAEAGNSRIDVFDLDGQFKFMFGVKGSAPQQMYRPEAAKVDSQGNIWVCDLGNDRIQKYSKDGKFIAEWGKKGSQPGEFLKPTGIAIDQFDNVYVGEVHNDRVQVFDKNFNFIAMFGEHGQKESQFGNIHGLIVDQRGYVFVADSANNRIQAFKPLIKD